MTISAFGVEHGQVSKAVDPLIRQHGLRGAPVGVDRDTRQQIWEARAKHLNTRRNRWHRTARTAGAIEAGTGAVAGGVAATIGAHQLREAYRTQNPEGFKKTERRVATAIVRHATPRTAAPAARVAQAAFHGKPGYRLMAVGAGSAVASASARRGRIVADKRKRKYSSASGGIAAGTARRMRDYGVSKGFPLGSPEAEAAKVMRAVHDSGGHAKEYYHNCVQCRGAAGKVRAQLKHMSTPENFSKSAFGVEHGPIAKAGALARNYDPERNRARRANAYSAIAAAGSAGTAGGAVRATRAGRGHRRAAAAHSKEAGDAFARGHEEQARATQRIARHGLNVGGKFAREGISNNRVQLGQTLRASQSAQEAFQQGFAAQGRHAESAAAAARSLRQAKGLAGASAALAATAYGVQRHRRGPGRSYGGYL